MVLRQVWLMGLAVCATGQVFAQDATTAGPAAPPTVTAATPAPPPTDAKTVSADASQLDTPPNSADNKSSSPLEGELDAEKIMAAQKAGYTIKNENGQTLLCRRDLQTGSRLRHTTSCMTAREWEQLRKDNELQLKALERKPRMTRQ